MPPTKQTGTKSPLETPFSFIVTRMYDFNKATYHGKNFNYPEQKALLEDNIPKIQTILNPSNHDRSKAYEKDLTHGKPYFACE